MVFVKLFDMFFNSAFKMMKYFANFGRTTANSSKLLKQGLYKPKSKTPLTLDFFLKNYLQDFERLIVM